MAISGQTPRDNPSQGAGIPRSITRELGWPQALIEDYDRISNSDYRPLCGRSEPEGRMTSNRGQLYIRLKGEIRELYFNPTVGVKTGWVKMI